MTEFTGFAPDPVPARPSEQSVRLLRRVRVLRKMQERARPYGMSLRFNRLFTNAIGLLARPPRGGSARWVRYPHGVHGRLVTAPDADPANGVLLWLHGGGLVSGSPRLEQELAATYAAEARIPVFLPRYRFPPEHPFPAAADDVLEAYRCLLSRGFPGERIRLGGMSAGGALVAGLLGDIGREGLPMPAAVLLVSPLLQLSVTAARLRDAQIADPTCSPDFIERMNQAYVGETQLSHPRLDYLGADMTSWPPILLQVGDLECLRAEAELLGDAMRAAGSRCEIQVWPGQVHGFPAIAKKLPESRAALRYGSRFLSSCG